MKAPAPGTSTINTFTAHQKAKLAESGLSEEFVLASGAVTINAPDDVPSWVTDEYIAGLARKHLPGIMFKHVSPSGVVVGQFGTDVPNEEINKYQQEKGSGGALSVHPERRHLLEDPSAPVLLVEGTKQSLCAARYASQGTLVIGMLGCWGHSQDQMLNPELAELLPGRDVVVCFDADAATKRGVWEAKNRLAKAASIAGVRGIRFATIPAGGNKGLDDWIGRTPEAQRAPFLEGLLRDAADKVGRAPAARKADRGIASVVVDFERGVTIERTVIEQDDGDSQVRERVLMSAAIEVAAFEQVYDRIHGEIDPINRRDAGSTDPSRRSIIPPQTA